MFLIPEFVVCMKGTSKNEALGEVFDVNGG
jgi:hypothetical protein